MQGEVGGAGNLSLLVLSVLEDSEDMQQQPSRLAGIETCGSWYLMKNLKLLRTNTATAWIASQKELRETVDIARAGNLPRKVYVATLMFKTVLRNSTSRFLTSNSSDY
jgi:hypothetical protein